MITVAREASHAGFRGPGPVCFRQPSWRLRLGCKLQFGMDFFGRRLAIASNLAAFPPSPTRLAAFATVAFTVSAVAGALLTVRDWSASSPLLGLHAMLLV